jgi:hypothetical protein
MADSAPAAGHNSKKIDFDKAAKVMKGELANHRDKSAKIRVDQSASWAKIEELGLNKKAAKHVFAMQEQSPAEVSDYLRTFIGLLQPLGLGVLRDMVDTAEGQTGIMVPLIEPTMVVIDGGGSVAEKAMKETAAEQAARAARASADSDKPVAH